jgi:hypothetical protein
VDWTANMCISENQFENQVETGTLCCIVQQSVQAYGLSSLGCTCIPAHTDPISHMTGCQYVHVLEPNGCMCEAQSCLSPIASPPLDPSTLLVQHVGYFFA